MSDHTIAVLLYVLVGMNAIVTLMTIAIIGKPRPPVTPKLAIWTVTSGTLVCLLEILAAGRLS